MPRDLSRSLIFIHIPKNAGKYIEDRYALSVFPGRESNQPTRTVFGRASRFFHKLDYASQARAINTLAGIIDVAVVAQHATLMELQLLGHVERQIKNSFMLSSVRNPYTRFRSIYCHRTPRALWSQQHFEEFAANWPWDVSPKIPYNILAFKRRQVDFLRDVNGALPVQLFLARVESLESDLKEFERYSGIKPASSDLNGTSSSVSIQKDNLKGGKSTSYRDHSIIISDRVRKSVYKYYREDFELLGYDP